MVVSGLTLPGTDGAVTSQAKVADVPPAARTGWPAAACGVTVHPSGVAIAAVTLVAGGAPAGTLTVVVAVKG
ncbi:hypothetical protein GCM10010345_90920 [Streptomyces canarius]|uniref:Uncharacterized protein n=1 Tax=Streptomyces canarius TaxID=285453 RepID=A0ABQ3DBX9_9ACTN|nr:hypothetical protein GCM10010345_90920 [Streptomyces canarius]